MTKLKAIVQFEYEATAPDELTLQAGDVLTDVKQIEPGWCEGILNGKKGVFPDNFVKLEDDRSAATNLTPVETSKKEPIRLVKVTHTYDSTQLDELALTSGDIVEVLDDMEPGWARGRLNGKEGLFPTNFVESYTKSDATNEGPKSEDAHDQIPSNQNIEVRGENATVDGPSFVAGDASDTKKAEDKIQEPFVKATVSTSKQSHPHVERCRATFDYPAGTDDELSLKVGDVIVITSKDCEDPGWWEGEVTDSDGRKRHGVFPDNFVELIPPDEGKKKETTDKTSVDKKPEIEEEEEGQLITQERPESPPAQAPATNVDSQVAVQESGGNAASDFAELIGSATDERQLTHPKRVAGPKNRRKPADTKRRKRANEAAEANDAVEESPDSEPEEFEAEPQPQESPKRGPTRGIQVMPALGGGEDPGEKPSWMVQLKKRKSQKKPDGAAFLNKTEEPEKPAWLSNLQKSKLAEEEKTPLPEPKPSPSAASSNLTQQPPQKPAQPQKPKQAPARPPISFKAVTEANSPELKRHVKADNVNQVLPNQKPSIDAQKPVALTKPKLPPPPKIKPVHTGAKPSSTSIDELKEELKAFKEHFANFRQESVKEMQRLSKELDDEKALRQALQKDMATLLKRDGSTT